MSKNIKKVDPWHDNSSQFPRLLAEINAVGLSRSQMKLLRESMDLSDKEITELFDRAEVEFEKIKRRWLTGK